MPTALHWVRGFALDIMARRAMMDRPSGRLPPFAIQVHIVLVLLEGTALFGCIYWMEAQLFTLGIVGLGLILMLLRFPTAGRARSWLERQEAALNTLQT